MAQVDFTKEELIEDLRGVFATKAVLVGIATKADMDGFPTKADLAGFATKADLATFATKDDLAGLKVDMSGLKEGFHKLSVKIDGIKEMLEDDARAESKRLDRVDRRSLKTARLLNDHLKDARIHG